MKTFITRLLFEFEWFEFQFFVLFMVPINSLFRFFYEDVKAHIFKLTKILPGWNGLNFSKKLKWLCINITINDQTYFHFRVNLMNFHIELCVWKPHSNTKTYIQCLLLHLLILYNKNCIILLVWFGLRYCGLAESRNWKEKPEQQASWKNVYPQCLSLHRIPLK